MEQEKVFVIVDEYQDDIVGEVYTYKISIGFKTRERAENEAKKRTKILKKDKKYCNSYIQEVTIF